MGWPCVGSTRPLIRARLRGSSARPSGSVRWRAGCLASRRGGLSTLSWRRVWSRTAGSCSARCFRIISICAPPASPAWSWWSVATGRAGPTSSVAISGRLSTCSFGEVEVRRLGYRARGRENLYPADAQLNLPAEKHSHGMRRLAALEAPRSSFQDAHAAILRQTGQRLGKRQLRELATVAARDFAGVHEQAGMVYRRRRRARSADAKAVVMREAPDRPHSAKRKSRSSRPACLRARSVTASGWPRCAPSMRSRPGRGPRPTSCPPTITSGSRPARARGQEQVVVGERHRGRRHDRWGHVHRGRPARPGHQRTWVALVDGNNHQIDRITKEARKRKRKVTIVVDLIHVLEYLWDRPGASLTRVTPPPSAGCKTRPASYSTATPASSPPRSAAKPPASASSPHSERAPTAAPTTCSPSAATSTTGPRWPTAGRSRPA